MKSQSELPRARTNNSVMPEDPSLLSGEGFNVPPVVIRAQRQITPLEEILVFKSATALRIQDYSTVLRSRRYCRQVWFYGISGFTGSPAVPTANVSPAVWGWSPETLVNQVMPWSGVAGSLIAPADGQTIDLWSVWLAGAVNDGLFISIL